MRLPWVAPQRLHTQAPPSLRRVGSAPFPGFNGTMECSDSLPPVPPRFVAFARRLPSLAPVFVTPAKSDADLGPGSFWVWHFPLKPVAVEMETAGRPKFLGNPDVLAPCSLTPAEPTRQAIQRGRRGPRSQHDEGSRESIISGLNSTA